MNVKDKLIENQKQQINTLKELIDLKDQYILSKDAIINCLMKLLPNDVQKEIKDMRNIINEQ